VHVVVVAPTFQERENIERFLEAVRAAVPRAHVLVVDDNSPDGTGLLADQAAQRLGQIQVLHRAGKTGLGSAYREGFAQALGGAVGGFPDVVVSMDVDFSHDPVVIAQLVAHVEAGAGLAIGSRYVPGGGTVNWPVHRRLLSRWGNRYTAWILRLPIRDCTSGFRAYSAHALRDIDPASTRAEGYAMLTEYARRLCRRGHAVTEVPISFVDRQHGTSKMSGRIVIESMLRVTLWGLQDLFGRVVGFGSAGRRR
jgi:dolichol-phosphate mannosyltransferase